MSAEMVEITSMFADYKAKDIPPSPTYFCLYIRTLTLNYFVKKTINYQLCII